MSARPSDKGASNALSLVAPVEEAFHSRWTLSALHRVDPDLHQLLVEQIDLYNHALVTGSDRDLNDHAGAMVRGWGAAINVMETAQEPHDAYLVGHDYLSMATVVIGNCRGSLARADIAKDVRDASTQITFMTPDEIAKIVGGMAMIVEAKAAFPAAEIIEVSAIPARAA